MITTDSSEIGRLDAVSKTWSLAGSLIKGRHGHNVIFDGMHFLVVGGAGPANPWQRTEKCTPIGETVICTEQGIALYQYANYPELTLVADTYGPGYGEC